MKSGLSFKTRVCDDYEELLKKCQVAFQIWNDRSQEIRETGVSGQEVGDELLRLQSGWANVLTTAQRS
jgi:hypothetical protein